MITTYKVCGCYVIPFFILPQLLPTKFTQRNSCCISRFMMKYMQNRIEIQASPTLVLVI